mgnify:CR=1 FL=1
MLLSDAAHLQEEDADYLNRKGLSRHKPALPLFDTADAEACLGQFETVPVGETCEVSKAFSFRFRDADGSLNCHGYGSSVAVTAAFGMVAASLAIESVLL